MTSKSVSGRIGAAAINLAVSLASFSFATLGAASADPLALAEPMRNPGMIFDNVLRDRGSDLGLASHLRRQVVQFSGSEAPGTILIDTANTYLYYVLGGGRAIRYGIGVGREGFTWSGTETIARKAEWPDWIPPAEMVARQPYLPRWVAGGPGNPLGARALPRQHRLSHPRHQPARDHRRPRFERLHPHAQRGRDGPVRPGPGRNQGRGAAELAGPRHRAAAIARLRRIAAGPGGAAAVRPVPLRNFEHHPAPLRPLLSRAAGACGTPIALTPKGT